jgi:Tol biopolymer transport system component
MTRPRALLFGAVATVAAWSTVPTAQTGLNEPPSREIDLPRDASVSPDGRYVAYSQGRDLVIREFSTGEIKPVAAGTSKERVSLRLRAALWSRDSQRLLYSSDHDDEEGSEIREVRTDGTGRRILVARNAEPFEPLDSSPDGQHILIAMRRQTSKVLLSLADGTRRDLPTVANLGGRAAFTPDGRHLISNWSDPKTEMSDIHIVGVDGTGDRPLIASSADEDLVALSPDGGSVIYTKDGDIWIADLAGTSIDTPPRLLKRGVGSIQPVGVTRNGALYYQAIDSPVLFRAPLEATTGKITASPERVSLRGNSVYQWAPAWSPDGRQLAYKRDNWDEDLFVTVHSIDTGEQREIEPRIAYGGFLSWSRDGHSLVADGGVNPFGGAPKGVHLVDVATGQATMVISKPNSTVAVNHAKVLPDGRTVVYLESWQRVVTRDLENGDEHTRYDSGAPLSLDSLALSPDGRSVAFRDRTKHVIQVLALADGSPRTVATMHEPYRRPQDDAVVAWSADGRFVIFSNYSKDEKRDGLWRVFAGGGTAENIGLTVDKPIHEIAVQPNGRSIVLVMSDGEHPGTRVIENLLPPASPQPRP